MELTIALIVIFSFQAFCNGFYISEVLSMAEKEEIHVWQAWQNFTQSEGWVGIKGFPWKCYIFVPTLAALVSKALYTSKNKVN